VVTALIEQGGINRCRGYVGEALAVEQFELFALFAGSANAKAVLMALSSKFV
jgi:hypothetical protein